MKHKSTDSIANCAY